MWAIAGALAICAITAAGTLVLGWPFVPHPAVVPMVLVTAVVLLWPLVRDGLAGHLDLAEPLNLAIWTNAAWHYVAGATVFAVGAQDRLFYVARLDNDDRAVVVTQIYALIGFVALGVASRSRASTASAARLLRAVPAGPSSPVELQVFTWTLLAIGASASSIGSLQGTFGFAALTTSSVSAVVHFCASLAWVAPIPLVGAWRSGASKRAICLMAGGTIVTVALQAFLSGNRGSILAYGITSTLALARADLRMPARRLLTVCVGFFLLVAIGVAYGSSYRSAALRPDGSVSPAVFSNSQRALSDLADRRAGVVPWTAQRMLERFDALASASVVVEQHRELAAAEDSLGLDGDVVRALHATFVPRVVSPDKPTSFDAQGLAELYFGRRNAYATTPFTDLLRNFGPLGIVLGMLALGFVLGTLHQGLASSESWTAMRAGLFALLALRAVNYEGSFASILPDASRLVVVYLLAIGIVFAICRVLRQPCRWRAKSQETYEQVEGGRPRVLIVCNGFPPASRGGSVRTLQYLVVGLTRTHDVYVVSRNHDYQDKTPLRVTTGRWQSVDGVHVRYERPWRRTPIALARLAAEVQPDVLFVNSLFATGPVAALVARRLGLIRVAGCLVAPEGECNAVALSKGALKKRLFLRAARLGGLYRDVLWRAADETEMEGIIDCFGAHAAPLLAGAPAPPLESFPSWLGPYPSSDAAHFVFVSGIDRIKGAVHAAQLALAANCRLDFYGPIRDSAEFASLQSLIAQHPAQLRYVGALAGEQVHAVLARSDALVLPTRGETFGYVIGEALLSGCAVLVSDRTPWQDLDRAGCGRVLPIEDDARWVQAIRDVAGLDERSRAEVRMAARSRGERWCRENSSVDDWARCLSTAPRSRAKPIESSMERAFLSIAALLALVSLASAFEPKTSTPLATSSRTVQVDRGANRPAATR